MTASIRRGSGWVLFGNLAYAACQYGILIAIARLGSVEDVGRFALGLAVAAPIAILTNLHLRAVLATDARHEHDFRAYLTLRLIGAVSSVLLVAGACLVLGYGRQLAPIVLLVGLAKAIESIADVVYGLLQRAERFERITISLVAKGVGSLGAIAAVLALTHDLVLAVAAMVLVWAVLLFVIDLRAASRVAQLGLEQDLGTLRSLAWVALPMGLVMCLASLTTNVPRYAIDAAHGTAALGYFATMAYLTVAATQPMIALGVSASPRLAAAYVQSPRAFRRLSLRFIGSAAAMGALVFAGFATLGGWLMELAYGPEYAVHTRTLRWLAAATAVAFVSSALGYTVTAARRFRVQLLIACVTLAVCGGASIVLVPRHGLTGAAWAVLVTEVVRALCLATVYGSMRHSEAPDIEASGRLRVAVGDEARAAV